MKRLIMMLLSGIISISMLSGCGKTESKEEPNDSTTITPTMSAEEPMSVVEESISEKSNDSEYPYLSAIQKSLNCYINNDVEGYYNNQPIQVKQGYEKKESQRLGVKSEYYNDYDNQVFDDYEEILKYGVDNNIHNLTQIDTYKNCNNPLKALKEMINDYYNVSDLKVEEAHFATFKLDSTTNNLKFKDLKVVCLVYLCENTWYACFFDDSFIQNRKET